jgi:hypothetical protein
MASEYFISVDVADCVLFIMDIDSTRKQEKFITMLNYSFSLNIPVVSLNIITVVSKIHVVRLIIKCEELTSSNI